MNRSTSLVPCWVRAVLCTSGPLLLVIVLALTSLGASVPWYVSTSVSTFALGGLYLAFGKADSLRIRPIDTSKAPDRRGASDGRG